MNRLIKLSLSVGLLLVTGASFVHAAERTNKVKLTDPNAVAAQVDRLILKELHQQKSTPSPMTSDDDFLRRLSLDFTGSVPSPAETTMFGLTSSSDKRAAKIDQLVASRSFAENWSGYWRDVIFSRATEARSTRFKKTFESWMADQIHDGKSWSEITTAMLTATGDVSTEGQTALIFAHKGEATEVASEASRIFLGVQVQCANCHDHPTDKWTREEFHQLAAYFPRIRLRPKRDGKMRSFEVTSNDNTKGNQKRNFLANPSRIIKALDKDGDKLISKEEAKKNRQVARMFQRALKVIDTNKDGKLSLAELKAAPRPQGRNRGRTEYYMPNLDDPQDKGTLTQPVYFLNGTKSKEGMTDMERRGEIAKIITSKNNKWFAKAFVNRVWGEMMGRGFYMPIDDMGPTRDADFPEVIELLSDAFIANNHDIQWLYRTIARTETYQRQAKAVGSTESSEVAFSHASPTRLRADQIFSSLLRVGNLEEQKQKQTGNYRRGGRDPRSQFATLFAFDPSTPQDEITGSIPQALFMMNSKQIESIVEAPLKNIVNKHKNNNTALNEVYLLVLSRSPSKEEKKICLGYIQKSKDRATGFQDIMWSLVNSTEFISKR